MPKLIICMRDGEDRHGHSCYIHAAGCGQLGKDYANEFHTLEGSVQEAVDWYLDDELKEMGFDAEIIKIYPCALKVIPND